MLKLWLIGNRTLCRPIRSVIILMIKQIGLPLRGRPNLSITCMITDRIGLHSVLLLLLIILISLLKQLCYFSTIIRLVLEILATLVKSSKFFKGFSFVQNSNNNCEESTIILSVIGFTCHNLRLYTVVLLWLDTCIHWTWLLFQ